MINVISMIQEYINRQEALPEDVYVELSSSDIKLKDYSLSQDERPIILINKKKLLMNGKNNGLLITDHGIHYRVFPRAFLTSITMMWKRPIVGFASFEGMRHFQIGEHDACLGTAYIGHNIEIDHEVKGLVRMGTGIEYDEEMIIFLNGLSSWLVEKGLLQDAPTEYAWQ